MSRRDHDVQYLTIRYRTIWTYAALVLVIVLGVLYLKNPDAFWSSGSGLGRAWRWIVTETGRLAGHSGTAANGEAEARFLRLEGDVEVRRLGWETFRPASTDLGLASGDTVETSSDGWAQVRFADGTEYTINPSSLVVVEENSVNRDNSHVAVNVTSGVVDLSTSPSLPSKSESSVRFADSTTSARFSAASEANVNATLHNGTVTLTAGSGQVKRGDESVALHPYQQVSATPWRPLSVADVPPSPNLLSPANLASLPEQKNAGLLFRWNAVPGVKRYHFKVAQTPFFDPILFSEVTSDSKATVKGIGGGVYYWTVISLGPDGKESQYSENFRFSVAGPGGGPAPLLVLDSITTIGKVVLIEGHTDPGDDVFVDGTRVPLVSGNGSFKYISQPLTGPHAFAVVAKNATGQTTTRSVQARGQ
jgi:hypothetical protein